MNHPGFYWNYNNEFSFTEPCPNHRKTKTPKPEAVNPFPCEALFMATTDPSYGDTPESGGRACALNIRIGIGCKDIACK